MGSLQASFGSVMNSHPNASQVVPRTIMVPAGININMSTTAGGLSYQYSAVAGINTFRTGTAITLDKLMKNYGFTTYEITFLSSTYSSGYNVDCFLLYKWCRGVYDED